MILFQNMYTYLILSLGYEGKKLVDETKGADVTFQGFHALPDWNFRASIVMAPQPGATADDTQKARYLKNLRVLDIGWIAMFNRAMTVKGNQYQQGGLVVFGSYG